MHICTLRKGYGGVPESWKCFVGFTKVFGNPGNAPWVLRRYSGILEMLRRFYGGVPESWKWFVRFTEVLRKDGSAFNNRLSCFMVETDSCLFSVRISLGWLYS